MQQPSTNISDSLKSFRRLHTCKKERCIKNRIASHFQFGILNSTNAGGKGNSNPENHMFLA